MADLREGLIPPPMLNEKTTPDVPSGDMIRVFGSDEVVAVSLCRRTQMRALTARILLASTALFLGTMRPAYAGPTGGNAAITVKNTSRMTIGLTFSVNGKKLPGAFRAPPGKSSHLEVPEGRVTWAYEMVRGGAMESSGEAKVVAGQSYLLECEYWDGKYGPGCSCDTALKSGQ